MMNFGLLRKEITMSKKNTRREPKSMTAKGQAKGGKATGESASNKLSEMARTRKGA